eukprot:3716860-Prymnesium_polylepis.2
MAPSGFGIARRTLRRAVAAPGGGVAPTLLHSIEGAADCVLDARWSPRRCALLATADAAGSVALWDVVQDMGRPAALRRLSHRRTPALASVGRRTAGHSRFRGRDPPRACQRGALRAAARRCPPAGGPLGGCARVVCGGDG